MEVSFIKRGANLSFWRGASAAWTWDKICQLVRNNLVPTRQRVFSIQVIYLVSSSLRQSLNIDSLSSFFIPTPSTICACRQNVRYPSWFGHLLQTRCKNLRLMGGKLGLPFIAGRVFWCCCRNLPVIHKLWKISMRLQLSWGIQTMKWHLTPKLLPYRFVFVRCLDTRYMCANSPLQALASRLWIPFNLDGLREATSKDHLCVRFFKR